MANINLAIFYAFTGNLHLSVQVIDYQWGLFYPSLYAYSIWSAYNRAKEINHQLSLDDITPEPNTTIFKYTGLFFGFLLGMHFGIYIFYLTNPVLGGLIFGIAGAFLGTIVENFYVAKIGYSRSQL